MPAATATAATQATSSGAMNEWFRTAFPILVVPVLSNWTAAICDPFAGKKEIPITDGHIATRNCGAIPSAMPTGTIARVAPGGAGLAGRQRCDREEDDRERPGRRLRDPAERADDVVLVRDDEGVSHPRQPEERDDRDDTGGEDARLGDIPRVHPAEQDDQGRDHEHERHPQEHEREPCPLGISHDANTRAV
jgi:hypothetical protein